MAYHKSPDAELRLRVLALAKQGLSYTHIRQLTGLNYRTIRKVISAEAEMTKLGVNVKTGRPQRAPTPSEEVKMNYVRIADRILDFADQIMNGRKNDVKKEIQNGITAGNIEKGT